MPADARSSSPLRYGVDAPYVPAIFGLLGIAGLLFGALGAGNWLIVVGIIFLAQAAVYLHTTLRGKFIIWQRLLDELGLVGDEQLLDVGCGRGAVLLATARRLPRGRAHGIDLWRSRDQSGNDEVATAANADAEGVADRTELHTGDMTSLPFPDGTFAVLTSSLAIHNLPSEEMRRKALDEALRVLEPGGRLVIVDIRGTRRYAAHLRAAGATEVVGRGLGPEGWFGGPWQAMRVVTAVKP